MFDFSWGFELVIATGIGMALIGRKDLPRVANFMGTQVGRAVGWIQGARVRADTYASQNELRQLHNQVRVGLRQLDVVRSEFRGSSLMSRQVGSTVGASNRMQPTATSITGSNNSSPLSSFAPDSNYSTATSYTATPPFSPTTSSSFTPTPSFGAASLEGSNSTSTFTASSTPYNNSTTSGNEQAWGQRELPPRHHTVAAVAEEQWQEQGIGFKSRAEQGVGATHSVSSSGSATSASRSQFAVEQSGSVILANLMQQTLIHDQYDRVMLEQQEASALHQQQQFQRQQQQQQES